ncbi:hypothetical protein H4R20_002010 [Coemansia guatemalensis]|uniref:Uncharacterized protein n=1 Tax=Coemansia guatemalensis TaxID=2761395 RepID=A0A9W8LVF4_9FUNG|nr:hypothetical protein H4R20_002010 [Coemansia guatemalensis]
MFSRYTAIVNKHIKAPQLRRFTGAHHPSASAANASANASNASSSWTNPDPGSELCVSTTSGFLPRRDPLAVLPSYYEKIDELLHEMPVLKEDGTLGLLHTGRFGSRIERELPLYDVEFVFDRRILAALYRDYSMLASAYLLEPCDIQFRLARNYGLARRVLPANIAIPLDTISRRLGQKPFLEHSTFTFYNYRRKDQALPITLDNLEPIRRFSGCDKEHNFIVGHVAAARQTDEIVAASLNILRNAQQNQREKFNAALRQYTKAMGRVNDILSQTLKGYGEHASFYTFLSGCKAQAMFNSGVWFENNATTSTHKYLGVAQSSSPIASLSTHLFQLSDLSPRGSLPCADGVDRLRAPNYRSFLAHVSSQARQLAIQSYALRNAESSAEYISALGQVLSYRYRQWANLRDSMHIQSAKDDSAFRDYLDIQTCHVRDIAELICRTHANTDFEALPSNLRTQSEAVVHNAEVIHRSLDRIIDTEEASPLPVSMIAY